jgi:CRISPR-associated protein Csd2
MEVYKVYWWEHNSPNGQYSSAKVHRLLNVKPNKDEPKSIEDYDITLGNLDGLKCEEIDGE